MDHPLLGRQAPGFALRNQHGETVALSALGGAPVLVMFYPFAFSRVCSGEVAELRQRWEEVAATGARVLAVSCDAVHTLRAYAEELGFTASELPGFHLVSDFWPHGETARAYGAFDEITGSPLRSSFVLDTGLTVRRLIWSERTEPRSLDQVLQALGEVSEG